MLKKSVQLMGHKTSIALEPIFWKALELIARSKKISLRQLISKIDNNPERSPNLSSALRVYVVENKDLFDLPITRSREVKRRRV